MFLHFVMTFYGTTGRWLRQSFV